MISRAFIPPWSLVMTKPETLGPDTSRKEAGTLVSRYNFTGKQFCTSHSEIQQKIIKNYLSICVFDIFQKSCSLQRFRAWDELQIVSLCLSSRHDNAIPRRIYKSVKIGIPKN
jgi:hypothetical protein